MSGYDSLPQPEKQPNGMPAHWNRIDRYTYYDLVSDLLADMHKHAPSHTDPVTVSMNSDGSPFSFQGTQAELLSFAQAIVDTIAAEQ